MKNVYILNLSSWPIIHVCVCLCVCACVCVCMCVCVLFWVTHNKCMIRVQVSHGTAGPQYRLTHIGCPRPIECLILQGYFPQNSHKHGAIYTVAKRHTKLHHYASFSAKKLYDRAFSCSSVQKVTYRVAPTQYRDETSYGSSTLYIIQHQLVVVVQPTYTQKYHTTFL